jgi:thiamine-phosphate pyrophosphorylase
LQPARPMVIPRLYAIVDGSCFLHGQDLDDFVGELLSAGVSLLQYRDKQNSSRQVLAHARRLKEIVSNHATLIMNDRPDLCLAANLEGVHVGQDDLSAGAARKIIGPHRWLGISTHNSDQIVHADKKLATYLAIGPVFATVSKQNPDPVVGVEGVKRARSLTSKPLVAIGGITRLNARSVIDAGADSVAVISDLIQSPRKSAEAFLELLR